MAKNGSAGRRAQMSEYQYYEFQAIDRKLGEKELRALRDLSTRASITPTSFVNEYNFGDFAARRPARPCCRQGKAGCVRCSAECAADAAQDQERPAPAHQCGRAPSG